VTGIKRASVLIAVLLISCGDPPWPWGVEPPPAEYAHREPKVPVIVLPLPLSQVNSACHNFSGDTTAYRADGCALLGQRACLVVIPIADAAHGYPQPHIDAIFAHEKYGHCNRLVHVRGGKGWKLRQ
jgi:hypothetical protein